MRTKFESSGLKSHCKSNLQLDRDQPRSTPREKPRGQAQQGDVAHQRPGRRRRSLSRLHLQPLEKKGQHFQYEALPFGLTSSPRVLTTALAVLFASLRQQGIHLYPYLDDTFHRAEEAEE
ncbi:UNVERIFIED_CONTAM: hypothetical protein K2H54_051606, partial [Gekko kuhli]